MPDKIFEPSLRKDPGEAEEPFPSGSEFHPLGAAVQAAIALDSDGLFDKVLGFLPQTPAHHQPFIIGNQIPEGLQRIPLLDCYTLECGRQTAGYALMRV